RERECIHGVADRRELRVTAGRLVIVQSLQTDEELQLLALGRAERTEMKVEQSEPRADLEHRKEAPGCVDAGMDIDVLARSVLCLTHAERRSIGVRNVRSPDAAVVRCAVPDAHGVDTAVDSDDVGEEVEELTRGRHLYVT